MQVNGFLGFYLFLWPFASSLISLFGCLLDNQTDNMIEKQVKANSGGQER